MNRTRGRAARVVLLLLASVYGMSGASPAPLPRATSSLPSAPQAGAETAAELNKQGSELIGQNRYDDALALFERALALARDGQDIRQEAYALLGMGKAHYWKADYALAGGHLEKALSLFEPLSDGEGLAATFVMLGALYYQLGNSEKALEYGGKALVYFEQAGDLRGKANVLRNISFVPTLTKEERFDYLGRALEIAGQIANVRLQGLILHDWGDYLATGGQFVEADEKLEQAARLLQQSGDRNALARVFTSMGRLFRLHGQPERALDMYRRALETQQAIGDGQGIIQSYDAMGTAYQAMGDFRKAEECIQRGLDLAMESGSEAIMDRLKGALGANYVKMREYARAIALLEPVVHRGKALSPDYWQHDLAAAYYELGRYEDALAGIGKSIAARREYGVELHDSLILRGKVLSRLRRDEEALADVREGMRLLEEQRAKVIPSDVLKRGYAERVQGYYSLAVELLVRAGHSQEALEVAEQGRARAFLDLLATRDVALRKNRSEELAELRRMNSSLRNEGRDPAEFMAASPPGPATRGAAAAAPASTLWSRWQSADLELRSFVAAEALSTKQLAAIARRLGSTILSYWVGDDATYIWVVRPDGTAHAATSDLSRSKLAAMIGGATAELGALADRDDESAPPSSAGQSGPADLSGAALTTRGGMTLRPDPSSHGVWRRLYDALVRPVGDRLPKKPGSLLTIIPHGPLFRLSFAALLDERGRYLIERYELHYAPAGAVLEFTRKKVRPDAPRTGKYVFVTDPAGMPSGEGGRRLPALPGARAEVADTARLLPAGNATVLDGAAATESHVRGELLAGRVIHFATHGIVRDDSPLDSFLALGASSSSPAEDGRLTTQDIYGLELNADLVFLSTCRSGRGRVTGDGVVGMTRSFVYAGTPSVVATLWDVADEPTRRLVPEFYRGYLRHDEPGRALRTAQLRLLSDLRAGRIHVSTPAGPVVLPEDPALWAAFVVLGEP